MVFSMNCVGQLYSVSLILLSKSISRLQLNKVVKKILCFSKTLKHKNIYDKRNIAKYCFMFVSNEYSSRC